MLMTARMVVHPCRSLLLAAALALVASAGCHGFARKHEARRIPQLGTIDATQPAELRKVSQSQYVIEPPDELEITTKPPLPTSMYTPFVVRSDGFVDLGLFGEAFVYGLTLPEAEERIAVQLNDTARRLNPESKETYLVSVRLANTQSKYYYVLGTVANPGRFKSGGNDTVLDAILQAGLKSNSLPEKAYLVRPHALGGDEQVYKVDWVGIKDRGDTLTNYQLFPGDRVVVPGTKPPGLIRSLLGN
jgi:polysaccharide biosynthesis/export protein